MNTLASFLALALVALQQPVLAVWPAPQHYSKGSSFLYIHQNIKITYNEEFVRWDFCPLAAGRATEYSHSPSAQMTFTSGYTPRSPTSKEIVQAGVSRALDSIFRTPFAPYALRKHGNLSGFEPDVYAGQTWLDTLQITQLAADKPSTFRPRAGDVDESYNLTISADGHTKLTAVSSIGILRGLETFTQLFYQHTTGTFWYTPYAPVTIRDAPRFPHRGVLLDTSRHFFSVADIKRTIDAMSWNKLNRLHVHVTDSQSWPLDVPSMPELARMGAYNPASIYSAADLEAVQQYGQHRGVAVYLEIDMPGHIGSVAESHPELIVAYDAQPYYWYCAQPPCGAFKLSSPDVDRFVGRLFDDVLPRVAPYSAYFHTGGDELNANDSMLDEGIRSNDTRVLQPLLQKFIDRQHGRVRAAGLTPLSWEEIPLEWNVTVGADTVIQTWLGTESVRKVTAKGLQVIDSNYNFWYLDCGRGQWLAFDNGAAFQQHYPFNDWCGPTKSWALVYSHDPTAGLSPAQAKLVLGGEVAVWTESIDPQTLDAIVWPRASAAGEVLWSGRQDASGRNRSQIDALPRLLEFRERMVARGVRAAAITQQWCATADDNSGRACELRVM
ncbi:glycoside hydrolase family 20 protein [Schizothecium vesticola]|uniref:Beta-hexosaminidase n=1 Tax=Schizothecium vesticola TaxID=314040 RepID=A0AA40K4U7_9PEZI|nr:glycoside hydrolase family 20 protein [Schizothecium vesticola]